VGEVVGKKKEGSVGAKVIADVGRRVGLFSKSGIIPEIRDCSVGSNVGGGKVGIFVESIICSSGAIDGIMLGAPVFKALAGTLGEAKEVVSFSLF